MEWYEVLVIVVAALFVLGVIVASVIRRLKGKSGCDCGGNCSCCSGCSLKKDDR